MRMPKTEQGADRQWLPSKNASPKPEARPRPAPEFIGSPEEQDFAWLQWSLIHTIGIDPHDAPCWRSLYLEVAAAEDLVDMLSDAAEMQQDARQMGTDPEEEAQEDIDRYV